MNVLVTGGTRGIGLATAKRFADAGWQVFITGRTAHESDGCSFVPEERRITCDLLEPNAIDRITEAVRDLDVLVNNAGIMHGINYKQYDVRHREEILTINLIRPVELMSYYGKQMAERGSGRIVNNASIAGQIGHQDIWYGITKAGIINATKSFARALGPGGVMVNCVAAGPVVTDMLETIPKERQESIKVSVISGRFAEPAEVAETMFWLGSTAPSYINGICIDINNGAFMR